MTRPLAIITGDWHMLSHVWKSRPTLSGDAECALRQVTDLARATWLPIIAAGDLFDSKRPDASSLLMTHSLLRNTEGYYIQGNHERQTPPWMRLVAPKWIHLEQQSVSLSIKSRIEPEGMKCTVPPLFETDRQWTVHGIDYVGTREQLQEQLDSLKIERTDEDAHLLILHQSASHTMPMDVNQLLDGMIPDAIDMAVIGHCHIASVFEIRTQGGRLIPAISPGGFHLLSILESPKKQMDILYADGSVYTLPLTTRRVVSLNLRDCTDSETREKTSQLLETLRKRGKKRPAEIAKPIVYARMNETTSSDAERILKTELGDSVHLFIKRELSGEEGDDAAVRLDDIDITRHSESGFEYIRPVFHKFEEDADVRNMVEQLLDTEPAPEVYQALKSKFLETLSC